MRAASYARTLLAARLRRVLSAFLSHSLPASTITKTERGLVAIVEVEIVGPFAHHGAPCLRVITHCDHAVHALTHWLYMCNENDLLEPIVQSAQQFHHVEATCLVQRTEDFVEDEQRETLPGALGDHLGDRQPQHQIGEILLAPRQHRLWNAVLENDDIVLIVQLELGVARVSQLTQKCARELRKLRTQLEIEVGAQIGERSIQLVVEPPIANQGLQVRSALLELLGRFLSGSERGRGTRHLLLRPGSRDL